MDNSNTSATSVYTCDTNASCHELPAAGGDGVGASGSGGRSFKIEFVRKSNTGATRDEYITAVANVSAILH